MLSSLYQKIYLGDICARHKIADIRALSILIKKIAESIKQPVSYRRLHHVLESTGSKISLPKVVDYVKHAEESWLILPIQNEIARLADKESTKKYYFADNGLLNLFLLNGEPSLLEDIVAIELMRRYGNDRVSYYNAGSEIDFVVEDAHIAIQVSYDLQTDETVARELHPLRKFKASHPDWQCVIVTFDTLKTYDTDQGPIAAVPVWQWLLS
jgi:predicted AAA+ superfamily ATPase